LQELPGGGGRLVGVLRGADAVVVLDGATLRETQRLPAPRGPAALAIGDGGDVFVAGELAPEIARYRWQGAALVAAGTSGIPGGPGDDVRAVRGLAAGRGGWLYLVEEQRGRLVALELAADAGGGGARLAFARRFDLPVGNGPFRVERVGDRLIVDCLLDHALVILRLGADGRPSGEAPIRIAHDGPIWSFAARPVAGGLLVAAGGVEDHPLDRTIGAFGYVDSFLYLYRVDFASGHAARLGALDLGDQGVVLPKALALQADPTVVRVSGYGTDRLLEVRWQDGRAQVTAAPLPPGTSAVAATADGRLVFADPLLDAWVAARPGAGAAAPEVVPVPEAAGAPARDPAVRLGEALIFTTLIAPWDTSEGPLSRFTCETCHFEGYVDGRIHHTGRGDVHAVTKPLLGLFNNRPHFSRALDPDLVSVAFNEFRVAGARSGHDPWFSLRPGDAPWLAAMGVGEDQLAPDRLRQAFVAFLMAFNHRPNPAALGRARFSAEEAAGAAVFRDRCEGCHEARLASDDPGSRVPFARWEEMVLARGGPIVWGKAEYKKTGVTPYVHEEGARVPSLRRLYKKHPYFTNGRAPDLAAVLAAARFAGDDFRHQQESGDDEVAAGGLAALSADEQRGLLAFLDLL
jgi:hypothetical protein